MGAVFAGTIRAPITSILIIVEMTRGYDLILPLMIANMTAYVIARRFRPVQIYEALLAQDGIALHPQHSETSRETLPIASLLPHLPSFVSLAPNVRASAVAELARKAREQHVFPVVTSEQRLLGVVTSEELAILESEPELHAVANALDLMRDPVFVRVNDDLGTALEIMLHHGIREVPVVGRDQPTDLAPGREERCTRVRAKATLCAAETAPTLSRASASQSARSSGEAGRTDSRRLTGAGLVSPGCKNDAHSGVPAVTWMQYPPLRFVGHSPT